MSKITYSIGIKSDYDETCHIRCKKTGDGSHILIPDNNSSGDHLTIHPSGVWNFHMDNKTLKNMFSIENQQKFIHALVDSIRPLNKLESAVIVPKNCSKIDPDEYFVQSEEHCSLDLYGLSKAGARHTDFKQFRITDDNLDFLEDYPEEEFQVWVVDIYGDSYLPLRNKVGFTVNVDIFIKKLDKIWGFA